MRELAQFRTNRQGGLARTLDGEITSVKMGGTFSHPSYGVDLDPQMQGRGAPHRLVLSE